MKFDEHSLAMAFASKVLQHPGSPYKRIPFEGTHSEFLEFVWMFNLIQNHFL